MKSPNYKVKIGIVGCGAIGSRMAKTIASEFAHDCRIVGLYDIDNTKIIKLLKGLQLKNVATSSLEKVIAKSDCVIEAVNTDATLHIVRSAIKAKKTVLAMSVGRLIDSIHLFREARKNKCYLLLPSGAIAGIDAVKAASLVHIRSISLTTRKPPAGLGANPYFEKNGIDLKKIKKETVVFSGTVDEALKHFPQNINVAATLALASQNKKKVKVNIIACPKTRINSHEIELEGDFGKITTKTENVTCPDNPKTSYLAVLSGLQTLKQFCNGILVGT